MKLGLYVGSFNPVHNGHIKVVNYLLENNLVDKILIIPTPNYWNKQDLVDLKHRINMLKYFENDKVIIDTKNCKYEYTYKVIENVKKDNPNATIYLIIGSDNLERLHEWKNIDKILENNIIVLRRGNTNINKYLENFNKDKFIVIDNFPFIDVSSTDIRNGNKNNVDERVLQYIKDNNLY